MNWINVIGIASIRSCVPVNSSPLWFSWTFLMAYCCCRHHHWRYKPLTQELCRKNIFLPKLLLTWTLPQNSLCSTLKLPTCPYNSRTNSQTRKVIRLQPGAINTKITWPAFKPDTDHYTLSVFMDIRYPVGYLNNDIVNDMGTKLADNTSKESVRNSSGSIKFVEQKH